MTEVVQVAPETKPRIAREHHGGVTNGVQWVLSVVVIAVFVITFNLQAFEIPSDSMEKTLLVGDYLLVDKIDFAQGGFWAPLLPYHKVQRGDIIVFRYPVHPQQHFVKRVIGVPGDRIHLSNKRVFINGQPITENYTIYHSSVPNYYRDEFPNTKYIDGNVESRWWIQMRKLIEDGNLIVPEGHYFVLGDNRDDSLDSRYWGFVPRENIVGRPLLIYWSVNRGDELDSGDTGADAKLTRLAYRLRNVFHDVRWNRTMKIVR
ncbi:MAG: signal peptidase I [Terriglobales bacterium]